MWLVIETQKNELAKYIKINKATNYRGTEKVGCKILYAFKTLGEDYLYVKKYRKK